MTAVSKQTLLNYFCSGGRATHSTSTLEYELEDLIDTIFDADDTLDGRIDGFLAMPSFVTPLSMYDNDNGDWENRNDGTFLYRIDTGDDFTVVGMGIAEADAPVAYIHFGTNSASTGNVYCQLFTTFYRPLSTTNTNTNSGSVAVAVGGVSPSWYWYKPSTLAVTMTNAEEGDLVRLLFRRYGDSGSDTFSDFIDVLGFTLE